MALLCLPMFSMTDFYCSLLYCAPFILVSIIANLSKILILMIILYCSLVVYAPFDFGVLVFSLAKLRMFSNTFCLLCHSVFDTYPNYQRWSRGHKARGLNQGQGCKKNSKPTSVLPRTYPLEAKDMNGRGQGPRTQAQMFPQKKKKQVFKFFFRRSPKKKKKAFKNSFSQSPTKKSLKKLFQRFLNFNCSKNTAVLEPRTWQFSKTWGFEAKAKAKNFKVCPRGRPRGQDILQDSTSENCLFAEKK